MAVTIKDVAQKAQVSVSTVSKVMSNSSRISEATKQRVRKVMEELNYHPNRIARNFVTQSSKSLGVVLELKRSSGFENPYIYEILGGIEKAACQTGYSVTLINLADPDNPLDQIRRMTAEKQVDGFVLPLTQGNQKIAEVLAQDNFPFVLLGEPKSRYKTSWVNVDNRMAGHLATEHLFMQGYRQPAFLGGPFTEGITGQRLKGFLDFLTEERIEEPEKWVIHGLDNEADTGYRLMDQICTWPQQPDSLVISGNVLAAGALRKLKEVNRKIPEDIGLVSFDNYPLSPYLEPPLTVVDIDVYELGLQAGLALINKIAKPDLIVQSNLLSFQLITRESSAKTVPILSGEAY